MLTNNKINDYRFLVEKNAVDFLKNNENIIPESYKWICDKSEFIFDYNWDIDFKKYFNIDNIKVNEIWNYYDISYLLKNIKWEILSDNVSKISEEIIEKILSNNNNKTTLSIINISSLEAWIMYFILNELWIKNVVLNFNKTINLNSSSKTLESVLYIMAYKKSIFFNKLTSKIVWQIKNKNLNLKNENNYIILDENNTEKNYNFLKIDDYLKNQIWFKEWKNIYRLDKYPDNVFLLNKNIENIFVFDNDNDPWKMIDYYKEQIKKENKNIKFEIFWYKNYDIDSIWYYEDYLVNRNEEYKKYKNKIVNETERKYWGFTPKEAKKWENYKKLEENINDRTYIPYIVLAPILIISFISSDLKLWNTNYNWLYWWWNYNITIWGWSNWSSSYTIDKAKDTTSKSIIKSFWWWGFSKWTS